MFQISTTWAKKSFTCSFVLREILDVFCRVRKNSLIFLVEKISRRIGSKKFLGTMVPWSIIFSTPGIGVYQILIHRQKSEVVYVFSFLFF